MMLLVFILFWATGHFFAVACSWSISFCSFHCFIISGHLAVQYPQMDILSPFLVWMSFSFVMKEDTVKLWWWELLGGQGRRRYKTNWINLNNLFPNSLSLFPSHTAPTLLWHCFLILFLRFIYCIFWLQWVFTAVLGLSVVAVSGGYSSLVATLHLLCVGSLLLSTGSRYTDFSRCSARAQ